MTRAVLQTAFGTPDQVLAVGERAVPAPADGEVQVEVAAAPVLPMDRLRIAGHYPLAQVVPGVAGSVGVGRIVVGPASQVGRWVCLPMRCGSWATRVNVPLASVLRLDGEIDPVQASLLRVNGLTAQALLDGVPARSWVVMNAANGGVGHYVCAIAARMKVQVAAVVRREEAVAEVSAPIVVVDGPGLAQRLRDAGMGTVHRAFDGVGGTATERLASSLDEGGRVLHYGATSRESPRLGVADAIFGGRLLQGFWLYRLDTLRGAAETERLLNRLLELGIQGPPVTELGFDDLGAAFEPRHTVFRPA